MKNLIYILLLSSISTPQLLAQDIIDKFNRIKFEEAINVTYTEEIATN